MTVDSSAKLVKCDFANSIKCNYTNSDNSIFQRDCGCALNVDGSSWCPATYGDSKKLL